MRMWLIARMSIVHKRWVWQGGRELIRGLFVRVGGVEWTHVEESIVFERWSAVLGGAR
jgi:hypothetical protein